MVDLDKFKPGRNEYLAAEDEALVRDKDGLAAGSGKGQRTEVSWLRKTEYLSTDPLRSKRSGEGHAGSAASSQSKERIQFESKQDVLKAVERSFQTCIDRETLRHPTNPSLKVAAIYPVMPKFEAPETYAQCSFDADPACKTVDRMPIAEGGERHAILKAMSNVNDPNDTFVWFYLPLADSSPGDERYAYARDYDIQRIDRQMGATNYVLAIPEEDAQDAVYTPVAGHFALKKRRAKSDHSRHRHTLKVSRLPSADEEESP